VESLEVHRPQTLAQALETKAEHPEAVPLAGGTDVMVALATASPAGDDLPPRYTSGAPVELASVREAAACRWKSLSPGRSERASSRTS
jgi:hypothetical protein